MTTVTKVNQWDNPNSGRSQWYVTLSDGSQVTDAVCYSEKAKALAVNEPLPEGWTVEPPKQEGWKHMLKAPSEKRSAGGGGYKGLGFDERFRLDAYQQERMDRRTALMQAIAWPNGGSDWLSTADGFYEWLRETAGITPATPPAGDQAQGAGTSNPLPPAPSHSGEEESAYRTGSPARGVARSASSTTPSASSPEPTSEEVGKGDLGKAPKPASSGPSSEGVGHADRGQTVGHVVPPTSSDTCAHEWGPAPSGNKRMEFCPKCQTGRFKR